MTRSVELLRPKTSQEESRHFSNAAPEADGVLLAGTVGHEAHWTRGWPRPALPLSTGSMIDALVNCLGDALSGTLTLCVNGKTEWLGFEMERAKAHGRKIAVHQDAMPRGSAGCLRDCAKNRARRTILAMGASVWLEDEPEWLLQRHRESGNALTLFCISPTSLRTRSSLERLHPTSIFCCEPSVLDFVRPVGFQDVKEQLVPALQGAGLQVGAVALRNQTFEVTDWESYMRALSRELSAKYASRDAYQLAPNVYCGDDVEIGRHARLVGPISLGNRCRIADNALLIGPVVLGDDCVVEESARLVRVVAPVSATFAANTAVTDLFVAVPLVTGPAAIDLCRQRTYDARVDARNTPPASESCADDATPTRPAPGARTSWILATTIVAACFAWAFSGTLTRLWDVWQTSADYGVGQLVPLAAAYMFYSRRRAILGWVPQIWLPGVGLFATGAALTLVGERYALPFLAYAGLVTSANGILTSLLGPQRWKSFGYPMLFLFLMCPLPQRFHESIMLPLQTLGASISGGLLELVGIPVVRMGHVLGIGGHQIAVAEACSGLRMALALTVVVAVVADLVRRPLWQKGVLLVSAVPVALACNIARIILAALLYFADLPWLAEGAFHDAAGLVMVPISLVLIVLELRWMDAMARRSTASVVVAARDRNSVSLAGARAG